MVYTNYLLLTNLPEKNGKFAPLSPTPPSDEIERGQRKKVLLKEDKNVYCLVFLLMIVLMKTRQTDTQPTNCTTLLTYVSQHILTEEKPVRTQKVSY